MTKQRVSEAICYCCSRTVYDDKADTHKVRKIKINGYFAL